MLSHYVHLQDIGGENRAGGEAERQGGGVHVPRICEVSGDDVMMTPGITPLTQV